MLKPLVNVRAHVHAMQHANATRGIMTLEPDGERNAIGNALPCSQLIGGQNGAQLTCFSGLSAASSREFAKMKSAK